jgi:tetratricopeptide (TPR) repeat protein
VLAAAWLAAQACDDAPREGAVRRAPQPAPRGPSASLLLVTLDTFRADAAGCGGDPRGRTPHLDRLARTGVQFETGLVPTPLTLPSHASMLTGLDPPAHGVRDNGTFRLAPDVPTLAERLRAAGFATAAFIAAFPLDSRFGLERGFDVYDDDVGERGEEGLLTMDQRDGGLVSGAARRWLSETADVGRRRFAFVHLFDAHSPTNAAPAVLAAAGGHGYRADVAWADRWLGEAVRAAMDTGEFWVVVLGDHGESLGDHQESTHGLFVYGATTRVPAVVWPAPAGERPGLRRAVFRAIDFPATALALLGVGVEPAPGDGVPLFARAAGPAYLESLYARLHYGWAALRGLQDGDWKYVDAPDPELYDLAADPGERRNVISEHPERAKELADRLRELAARERTAPAVAPDAEAVAALESLGYLTGGPEGGDAAAGAGADPKSMIAVQSMLERAQSALSSGQPDPALVALRMALARDPGNKDVHQTMGIAHAMAGRHGEAADWFRRCLELPPHRNDRVPRFELASSLIRLGRHREAAAELETVVSEFPDDAAAWYNLGIARDELGRPEQAREAWRKALEVDPGHPLAGAALGR